MGLEGRHNKHLPGRRLERKTKSYMGDVERCHISRLCFLCWVFDGALVGGRNITVLCTVVDWRKLVISQSFRAFVSFNSSIQTSEIKCAPLNSPSISALEI